jgi:hypothetical protein
MLESVVFSVGRNRIGGRLWLLDGSGNLFDYAHLQRYSPLAVDASERDRPSATSARAATRSTRPRMDGLVVEQSRCNARAAAEKP